MFRGGKASCYMSLQLILYRRRQFPFWCLGDSFLLACSKKSKNGHFFLVMKKYITLPKTTHITTSLDWRIEF